MRNMMYVALATVVAASAYLVAACYECQGPDCANLPPVYPEYPPSPRFGAELDEACDRACLRLRELHCPEGEGSVSGETCRRTCLRASALRPLPLLCWADAGTVASAKGCGSLRCVH